MLLYIPKTIAKPGAIRYKGEVEGIKILERKEIKTTWQSHQNPSRLQIVYDLESIEELNPPILNMNRKGKEERISQPRWTTQLAMARAKTINELLLESESDWWLYDNLRSRGVDFSIKIRGSSSEVRNYQNISRVWFVIREGGYKIRFSENEGFVLKNKYGIEKTFMFVDNLFKHCFGNVKD
ncbi:MAG: hypothetical protein JRI36_13975 [Deltaproteobacteria bacterium]|nr:hypothetical protein [Deltaproteobacteria bacterium]